MGFRTVCEAQSLVRDYTGYKTVDLSQRILLTLSTNVSIRIYN